DKMCGCADKKDADCAKKVTDEMSKWATENAGKADTSAKPTEEETKVGQQLAECTTKAMMAGMGNMMGGSAAPAGGSGEPAGSAAPAAGGSAAPAAGSAADGSAGSAAGSAKK
nr:hypothetical protein [Kofleriaceae bacterium]